MTAQQYSEIDPPTENIFHFLSKIVIVIPFVVLVVAFFMKANGKLEQTANQRKATASMYLTPYVTQKINALPTPKTSTASAQFNLTGPLVCDYIDKESSLSASVKNKNINVKLTDPKLTQNIIVKGDCLYKWDQGKTTGEKVCKVGKLLDMFDTFSKLGMVDMSSLMGELSKSNPSATVTPPSLGKITESCKKAEIKDNIFDLPKNVTFKESTLEEIKK